MSAKRVLKTALGVTSLAAAGGAGYAYLHPEVLPDEVKKALNTYKFFSAPQTTEAPKKLADPKPMKAIEIRQPINDESLSPNSQPKYSSEGPATMKVTSGQSEAKSPPKKDDGFFTALNPVDVNKPLDETKKPKSDAAEKATQLKAAEAKILSALETAESTVKAATDAKYKTIQAIKAHAAALKKAVDDGSRGDWTAVNAALAKADGASQADISREATSRNFIDKLRKAISEAKTLPTSKSSSLVLMANESAAKLCHQLDELNHLAEKARLERRVFNQYKDLIEQSRRHFADELKSIVPGMDVNAQQGTLTKDELDALLSHAYLRVSQLREQLIEQQVREEQHIANAIEDQQKADAKIAGAQLDLELRRVRENVNFDVERKVLEERKTWETELEARLQRASLAHAEHLESVVRTQKQLHDIENAKLVEEAVSKERSKHAKDVEVSIAKLHGIEHALQSRVAMDAENRRAKQYWLACQNLVESIVHGKKAGERVEARRKPLAKELSVIREACENDDFVQSIINLFPASAVEKGVFTEQDLRNRFNKIYKLGRQTAKIDENGGGLLKYLLSYAQSLVMVEVPRAYSPDEPINVATPVDAYDVLARAKYFVEHDDFASAIRLVQLLDGQPARLARDWVEDARAHLETRFLAKVLAAHATVTSIRSIY